MLKLLSSLVLLISLNASAVTRASARKSAPDPLPLPQTIIMLNDPEIDPEKVRKIVPGAKVYTAADGVKENDRVRLSIPDQIMLFEKAGLTPHVRGMDQFERDLMIVRLRSEPLPQVKKRYAKIPPANLSKAQEILKAMR